MPNQKQVLVATLGGQPQIVTFTLDLLLENFPITDVIVVHPKASEGRLRHSLTRLMGEFAGNYYQAKDRIIHFQSYMLVRDDKPIDDIQDEDHVDGTLDTFFRLISDLKLQQARIHLSVTGGRRLMGLLALSAASLKFDPDDRIWHLYTPDDTQVQADGGVIMHMPLDGSIKLIPTPSIFPGAYSYSSADSFYVAEREQRSQLDAQQADRCRHVVSQLTARQSDVLRAFAAGLNQKEVSQRLSITSKTVDNHKAVILDLCREIWMIDEKTRVGYHFLYTNFATYFINNEYIL
ncbi:CRISPR-associated ring nuclease [Dictyobacter arantiisoli]|uniref:Histidine kinase n=1 Tax=Dictyobacter arantiisoli TaxID=2014874 RepID=A0A5A5TKB5_9CHLR|nr:CRISPR-associated ring nuclease [Dictyobacter arantiisoli]GCF11712.1 histidine kinase [Dictyobacter arantiisoli]